VLLHLCQPIEPRLEELGKTRPNGGVTYPGVDEVVFFFSLSHRDIGGGRGSLEDS